MNILQMVRRKRRLSKQPKLFLHIGMNKTGTSVIQHVLSANRAELANRGLLYPDLKDGQVAHYAISDMLGFTLGKAGKSPQSAEIDQLKQKLVRQIDAQAFSDTVISSEFFVVPRNIDAVKTLFADFDCRIVIYLRRHDHWWAAVYNQAVKTVADPPWRRGVEAFLRFHRKTNPLYGDYRHLVERWANVFGEQNILVRPYETQQNKPNIVADFLDTIGRPELASLLDKEAPRINESLSANHVYLIDILQRSKIAPEVRAQLIRYVLQHVEPSDEDGFIPPPLRRQLVDDNAGDYAYIARNFMGRENGELFLEPLPDPDAPWEVPHHPRYMEVVELLTAALRPDW